MGIVDSLLSVPAQPSCCKQLLTPQQRGTCWLLVPCNMLVLTPSHPPLSLSSRSEIQFRQVAGDFERFQGKWMLQGIGGTAGGSSSGGSSSSSDAEVSRDCIP